MSPPCMKIRAGSVKWEVLPGLDRILFDERGLRLQEWLDSGLAQVVKHGPHRTVYRVDLPEARFFLKHYRLHDLRAWLRELVRPSKGRIERDHSLSAAERGVPTIEPLALGESATGLGPQDSFLITRALDDATPLGPYLEQVLPALPAPIRASQSQKIAIALGALMADSHAAGVVHGDLHAGNILLRWEGAEARLYLIDMHAIRVGAPLSWTQRRDNLVVLNRWFVMRASRSDRLRFWREYSARAKIDADPRDLEKRTRRSNNTFWRHRDRRCLETNRYYEACRTSRFHGMKTRNLDTTELATLMARPDEPLNRPDVTLLKDSRSSKVGELILTVDGLSRSLIYKRFRASAARRSWIQGHGLRERCLPTPRPLAVFWERGLGRGRQAYILTEKLPDAKDLHERLREIAQLPAAEALPQHRLAVDDIARMVRELHGRGLCHRDLKAANILHSQGQFWFIDLVGVRLHTRIGQRERAKNLARLNASFHNSSLLSRSDRLRFLRVYFRWGLLGRAGWKEWWRAIARATAEKVERNARNGRVLA